MLLMTETEELPKTEQVPEAEIKPKKKKGAAVLTVLLILLLAGGAAAYVLLLKPAMNYKSAEEKLAAGDHAGAAKLYAALGDYKDAAAKLDVCLCGKALDELKSGSYDEADGSLKRITDRKAAGETVLNAVLDKLAKKDLAGLKTVLERFGSLADLSRAETEAGTLMAEYIRGGEDDQAEALYGAIAAMDADGILRASAEEEIRTRLEAGDIPRVSALISRFGSRMDIAAPVREKLDALRTSGDLDGAAALMNELDGTLAAYQQEAYLLAYEYAKKAQYAEAAEIYEKLGDYKESRTFLQEVKYRLLISGINEAGTLAPEDFARFRASMQELDGIEGLEETRKQFDRNWIDAALFSDTPEAYAEAMKDAGFTEEEKADHLRYLMEKTPELVTVDSNNFTHYHRADGLKAILTMTDLFAEGSGSAEAKSFSRFVNYLITRSRADMPTVDELRPIWDLRPDLAAFCFNDEPLMNFLVGRWADRNGTVQLFVSRDEKGTIAINYNLPMPAKGNAFQASFGGLNVMISKLDSARVCSITIENCDTIELYNVKDRKTYTLIRTAE